MGDSMGQPVIITTPAPEPAGDTATAFVAGATAVIAGQAAEAATEAEQMASAAVTEASRAADVAYDARSEIEGLRADVAELHEAMMDFAGDVVAALDGDGIDLDDAVDDGAPPKVTADVHIEQQPADGDGDGEKTPPAPKSARQRSMGAGWWFKR